MSWKTLLTKVTSAFKPKEEEKVEEVAVEESKPVRNLKKPTWKYTDDERLIVVDLLARGLTPSQIKRDIKRYHNMDMHLVTISQFATTDKWKDKLKELKEKYALQAELLDASQKHVRVNRMEAEFDNAIEKGKIREALSAHEKIQKEYVESKDGDTINLLVQKNSLYQQFNNLSPQELLERQRIATQKLKESQNNGPDRQSEKD